MTEKPNGFSRGSIPQIHPPQLGAATVARISTAVKKMAASEVFVSAAEIVNKVVKSSLFFQCFKSQVTAN